MRREAHGARLEPETLPAGSPPSEAAVAAALRGEAGGPRNLAYRRLKAAVAEPDYAAARSLLNARPEFGAWTRAKQHTEDLAAERQEAERIWSRRLDDAESEADRMRQVARRRQEDLDASEEECERLRQRLRAVREEQGGSVGGGSAVVVPSSKTTTATGSAHAPAPAPARHRGSACARARARRRGGSNRHRGGRLHGTLVGTTSAVLDMLQTMATETRCPAIGRGQAVEASTDASITDPSSSTQSG